MFDAELIQQLKQTNISIDGEKTKERVKELWNTTSKEEKQTIESLAGVARATVYRIYSTGSISAKLAVAIAQTLNVNPYFLTGEADEQEECTDELLEDLLKKHGYEKKLAADRRKNRRKAPTSSTPENKADELQKTADELAEQFDREVRETLKTAAEEYKREHPAPVAPSPVVPEPDMEPDISEDTLISDITRAFLDSLTEDDMILLLRSIQLRAKSGLPGTAELSEKLKLLLLS